MANGIEEEGRSGRDGIRGQEMAQQQMGGMALEEPLCFSPRYSGVPQWPSDAVHTRAIDFVEARVRQRFVEAAVWGGSGLSRRA